MAARKRDDLRAESPESATAVPAQDSQSLHWHIAISGNAHGPYTLQQMLAFRGADRLAPDTFVHLEGWAEWRRVGEVSELDPSANRSVSRVPLLKRPAFAPAAILASRDDDVADRRPSTPPPLPVAMGFDPIAEPELEGDPPTVSGTFSTASWDLDAMPAVGSLAAPSRLRRRGPTQRTGRPSRVAPGDSRRAGWSEAVRRARSAMQSLRVPGAVRRTWDAARSRVQAVVQRVTAAGGMSGVLGLARRRLRTALPGEVIAGLGRRMWARTLRDTHAFVQRMRALGGEHQAWRRALRRVAAVRLAGARAGTVATFLLAGLLAGAASFVGANVLHGPEFRSAHSTPQRAPASAHAASGFPPFASMSVTPHPVTCEAEAPVTAVFALHAGEVHQSTPQPVAGRALGSTRSGAAQLHRPRRAARASRKGSSQASSQARLAAGPKGVAAQDRAPR